MLDTIHIQYPVSPDVLVVSSSFTLEEQVSTVATPPRINQNLTFRGKLRANMPSESPIMALNAGTDLQAIRRSANAQLFDGLTDEWKTERGATSSITEMAMCRAHLEIVAMGPDVIPLILRQMQNEGDEPDMWFV